MAEQQFSNHTRLVPMFHGVTFLLIGAAMAGATLKLFRSYETGLTGLLVPIVLILLSLALMFTAFYARSFALKAQDRAIRAEENLRHYILTGKPLPSALRVSQIVALRFASEQEFLGLVQKAVAENLSAKQIKQSIQQWKGDYHRV